MEVITIIAVANSVQYLYKFVKIAEVYYSSTEILHKLTAKTMYKHFDNANTAYETSTYILAATQPKGHMAKKRPKPPLINKKPAGKSTQSNRYSTMSKRAYKFFSDLSHAYFIHQLERAEARDIRHREVLYTDRKRRDAILDRSNEERLFGLGYLRDETSRYYISPSQMLNDVVAAVQKNMTDPKWTAEDKARLKALINNDSGLAVSLIEFERFDELFYYCDLLDRITKRPFTCNMLENDRAYSIKTIMWLQNRKALLSESAAAEIASSNRCVV